MPRLNLDITIEERVDLGLLARKTGRSKSALVREAMVIQSSVLEALKDGGRLMVRSPDGKLKAVSLGVRAGLI